MQLFFSIIVIATCILYQTVFINSEKQFFIAAGRDNIDFESSEDVIKHERFARHVQFVTESVVDHIVKELKSKFPEVNKRQTRGKLNQFAEDLNTILRIMKRKRIRTVNLNRASQINTTMRSPIFWKNKYLLNSVN